MFDAYVFISGLIKSAQKSIVLIDNYIDETVLTLFSKNKKAKVSIYTKEISKQLKLDLEKYNAQYKSIEIKQFKSAHDRFIIMDNKEIYHIGASLKDLGKKWFAFSKFNIDVIEILKKLEKWKNHPQQVGANLCVCPNNTLNKTKSNKNVTEISKNTWKHIIENAKTLKISEYILNNPLNWKKDELFIK